MIGQLLKQERLNNNLTQKQLAEKSGISYVSINRIENGKNTRFSVVDKLFTALGKKVNINLNAVDKVGLSNNAI